MAPTIADLEHLRRARDFIDREYARPLGVAEIARVAHSSPAHFSRRYAEAFGESPHRHLMTRRIERAKALLRAGELSVSEVCLDVGFVSLGSFSARFREVVGLSPSDYRRVVAPDPRVPACLARGMTRPPRYPAPATGTARPPRHRTPAPEGASEPTNGAGVAPGRSAQPGSGCEKRRWLPDGSRTAQSRTP